MEESSLEMTVYYYEINIQSCKNFNFIYSGLVKLESCRAHNPSLPFESAPATNKTQ